MAKKGYIGVASKPISMTNLAPTINGNSGWSAGTSSNAHTKYANNSLMITGTTSGLEATSAHSTAISLNNTHIYYARVEVYQESVVGSASIYWPIAEPTFFAGRSAKAGQWTIASAVNNRNSFSSGNY